MLNTQLPFVCIGTCPDSCTVSIKRDEYLSTITAALLWQPLLSVKRYAKAENPSDRRRRYRRNIHNKFYNRLTVLLVKYPLFLNITPYNIALQSLTLAAVTIEYTM